jgi:hypothetical protein
MIIGAFQVKGGQEGLMADHWDGTNWTVQRMPFVTDALGRGLQRVLPCASAKSCTAVGGNVAEPALFNTGVIEHWNGRSWAMQHAPLPQPGMDGAELFGVSCATTTSCTAIGLYGHPGDRPGPTTRGNRPRTGDYLKSRRPG